MLPVDSVVELLELEQILVCRAERAHPVVLADISEKHHSSSFVVCAHGCPPILFASEFAEPGVALIEQSEGSNKATASLPFPLPTYATDVLLGGVCIFRGQRARPIKLLYIGLVVL
jgi:hypothetical protein